MCHGSYSTVARRAVLASIALALCACDPSFDTDWRKRAAVDASSEAGELDAEPSPPDATAPADATTLPDADGLDGTAPPLPMINCSAVVIDASLVSCETDCLPACIERCGDAAVGCADAALWLPCWQCGEGGVPPTI